MKFRHLVAASLLFLFLSMQARSERPKIIVAILVDQLRYDYLERFHDQFDERGFKLLTDRGAFMTYARYDYVPTITGPGHASVFSGAPPAMHGIIANDWFDRRVRKSVYCVSDPTVTGVGTTEAAGKMSPRNFIGANFADQLRLQYQSKVVGISMKDRGAILPAGKKPLAAYWFESSSGNFVSSSYYMAALPAWVNAFNERKLAPAYVGQKWERLLPEASYERPDKLPGEGNLYGEKSPTFPHLVIRQFKKASAKPTADDEPSTADATAKTDASPNTSAADTDAPATTATPAPTGPPKEIFDNILATPYSNQLLAEFARAAIEGEHLGEGPGPDLLTISFSAVDACGHKFGPYSQEVQDITLRLDRELSGLFAYLDKRFGLANVCLTLTADHGVMPTPEFASQQGFDGQRADEVALMADLQPKLSQRFGTANVLLNRHFFEGQLYFNQDALREKDIAPEDVVAFIREWALATGKFQACYGREQILDGRVSGPIGERVARGYNAERSGDAVLIYKPFVISWASKTGTTHGSPYSYDTHVPVLFYGAAFHPGRYADEFYITDLVPTLCASLHMVEPPGCTGKPFTKVLREEPGAPAGSTR